MAKTVEIYDTTLRDGSQGEGVNFSLGDKIRLTKLLDELGVHYVEGGWPGSNPKDMEYFAEVRKLRLKHARVAAFGSTRHATHAPSDDPNLRRLVAAKTPVITIFGKSWDLHVRDALRVPLEKNLEMIFSSVKFLRRKCDTVLFDAEHFFDGYAANPEYALRALEAAAEAGACALVLCDTNGGSLPGRVREVSALVCKRFSGLTVGIHTHNDGGMATANSVEAVLSGARHVQGTMNGFGERTGNADLTQVVPTLELKLGLRCLGAGKLAHLTEASRYVYETANLPLRDNQPFVGRSAFAHKGGVHVSAVARNAVTYEHVRPETVGNERRILISELSGRSNIAARARVDLSENPEAMRKVLEKIMEQENEGYAFENADGSFDLLVNRVLGVYRPHFELVGFRVMSEFRPGGERLSEATVKLRAGEQEFHTVSEGEHGPVNAMDKALRKALTPIYPELEQLHLIDYKVHIVNPQAAAEARVRVVVESAAGAATWGTVGVSANIIEASAIALVDSLEYLLLRADEAKARRCGKRR